LKKLKTLTFLPIIIITISFFFFGKNAFYELSQLQKLQKDNKKVYAIATLINDLQQERGLSSGYIASKGKNFHDTLQQKQKDVTHSFENFLTYCHTHKIAYRQKLHELQTIRRKIQRLELSANFIFDYYSKLIEVIENDYLKLTLHVDDTQLKNFLQSYTNLSFMNEALGQIRGSLNGVLSKQKTDYLLIHKSIYAQGIFNTSLQRFEAVTIPYFLKKFDAITKTPNYIFMQKIGNQVLSQDHNYNITPDEWFRKTTNVINQLYILQQEHLRVIQKYINEKKKQIQDKLLLNTILFLFFIIFIIWISLRLKDDILKSLKILNEYKDAVDRSSIVSKTDIHGRITYVNEKFCSISGYTSDELLGKAHSIVRHPDMPKIAFKNMWNTILAKKPWYGIVKNKKKNGSYYIVEVTINPILNQKGEIEEFIAIRNDITDVIKLHEELEHTQEDIIFRMAEIGETRSQETGFHVRRVAKYSELLAKYYGLSEEEIKYLTTASPMHDIGKVGIPDAILHKQGALNHEEWKIMQKHAQIGYDLFKDSDKPLLQTAAIIAYEHHEKWDGTGYPRGLSGKNIHIYGRITALADVFDALGSNRCYKMAWSDEKLFEKIRDERGKHFDPKLVDIFFEHIDEFLLIRDKYNDCSSFMKEQKD
jgi:PAS domain S-box-containing protein